MTDPTVAAESFFQIDLRVGRIIEAAPLEGARKPAFRLVIDFGPLGLKGSSAQLTQRYTADDLVERLVIAVVNLPPRRVAGFKSEVLVLGAVPGEGDVTLLAPDDPNTPLGTRIG